MKNPNIKVFEKFFGVEFTPCDLISRPMPKLPMEYIQIYSFCIRT